MVLQGAAFLRAMTQAIVVHKQISILEHVHAMLTAKRIEWVIKNCELILETTELPDNLSARGVDLYDRSHMSEGDDVLAILIDIKRVGMVEVERRIDTSW